MKQKKNKKQKIKFFSNFCVLSKNYGKYTIFFRCYFCNYAGLATDDFDYVCPQCNYTLLFSKKEKKI